MKTITLLTEDDVRRIIADELKTSERIIKQLREDIASGLRHALRTQAAWKGGAVTDEVDIRDLPLPWHVTYLLQNYNVNTVGELCACSEQKLLTFRNLGKIKLDQSRQTLGYLGRELAKS